MRMVRAKSGITCDGPVVRTIPGRCTNVGIQSDIDLILFIRVGVVSHCRIFDAARVIAIEPGTLWDVLLSAFEPARGLDAVVPSMAAVPSDVTGPSSTSG